MSISTTLEVAQLGRVRRTPLWWVGQPWVPCLAGGRALRCQRGSRMTSTVRSGVFVSYSHADIEWLKRLKVHVRPLVREKNIAWWDDTMIKPGADWRTDIRHALACAKVAVLLISADFLASEFVADEELPNMLRAAEEDGVPVIPLIVSPSRFAQTPSLARFQAINPPNKPLAKLRRWEQEEFLAQTAEAVNRALSAAMPSTRDGADFTSPAAGQSTSLDHAVEVGAISHADTVMSVRFSPDGKWIATASADNRARIWDAESQRELAHVDHRGIVWSIAFAADGMAVASTSSDGTARIWEPTTGREMLPPLVHTAPVGGIAFSPDGAWIATACNDMIARIWDSATGGEVVRLPHKHRVRDIAFSPEGARVATACRDKTARIWHAVTGEELTRITHDDKVNAVSFNSDGALLATGSADSTARIWDAVSGAESVRLAHHVEPVYGVAFCPNRDVVATASSDMTARIWDSRLGRNLDCLHHRYPVLSVAWDPEGARTATAAGRRQETAEKPYGLVTIWQVRWSPAAS